LGDNVLTETEILIGLPGYQLTGVKKVCKGVRIRCGTWSQVHALTAGVRSGGARGGVAVAYATKTGDADRFFWRLMFASGCVRDAGVNTGIACLESCRAREPVKLSGKLSMNCIWMESTAAGWAGERASERLQSSATFSTGSNASSRESATVPSGARYR
jgi:hypothetical protein